jgi:HSP20 family protein
MSMVRYDPFRSMAQSPFGLGQLQNEINRLFSHWADGESSGATAGWMPSVDIHEFDDRFQLFVDLPGVDPKSVDITLESGVLSISGERQAPAAPEGENVIRRRSERGHGRFHRRFILPDTVDAERVQAADRNGVVEISIPKQAKAQPRRIKVAA